MRLVVLVLGFMLAACSGPPPSPGNGTGGNGGGGGGGSGGGGGGGGGFVVGPHEPMPVIPNQGGPTLSTLQLVTVTFAAHPNGAKDAAFGDFIVGSMWLKTVGADYGLQSATHAKKVTLTQTAGATVKDADVQALVASKIADGTLPSGNQALYVMYYP